MSRDEIPPGTLYLLILKTLAVRGKLHGYEIAESIERQSEEVFQVEEGSLYPALQRMLIKGWVTAETDGSRRRSRSASLSA
jgi:PadR family transcriptional regulator PadR